MEERDKYLASALPVMDEVFRLCSLLANVKDAAKRDRERAKVAQHVADTIALVVRAAGLPDPQADRPPIQVVGVTNEDRKYIPRLLYYLVRPDENIVAVARMSLDEWRTKEGYAVLTTQRLFLLHDDSFINEGEVFKEIPLTAIRMRKTKITDDETEMGGPNLFIKTRGDYFEVEFHKKCSRSYVQHFMDCLVGEVVEFGPTVSEVAARHGLSRTGVLAQLARIEAPPVLARVPEHALNQLVGNTDQLPP